MRNVLFGCVVVLALCAGCGLNQQFVAAVDGAWTVIGPEYIQYVQQDSRLDADTKTVRVRTAQLLTEVIEEAQK